MHERQEAEAHEREQLEELGDRIQSRQQLIKEEQVSVEQKIAEATRPGAAKRDEKAQAHSRLAAEVEDLRCFKLPFLLMMICQKDGNYARMNQNCRSSSASGLSFLPSRIDHWWPMAEALVLDDSLIMPSKSIWICMTLLNGVHGMQHCWAPAPCQA